MKYEKCTVKDNKDGKKQTPYYKPFFNITVPCKLILLQMDISKIKIFS